MLTPIDIQSKEFSRGFKGYKDVEVDGFLDQITFDYEKLFKENVELKDKITVLNDQIRHYNPLEQALQKTLLMAQATAEEVTVNAKKKAEDMITEAHKEYQRIISRGNDEIKKTNEEHEKVRKEIMLYKARFKSLINSQLEMLEDDFDEFLAEDIKSSELLTVESDTEVGEIQEEGIVIEEELKAPVVEQVLEQEDEI